MAESSSHNPFSREITPKEEPATIDNPEIPTPFLHAHQIEFFFDEISFTTNNEVALLYPSYLNSEYFREVSDFISKCYLKEAFIRAPTQYKEYLCKFWYTTKTLDDSKIWALKPNQHEGSPFTDHMKAIYNIDVHVDSQAPKTSSQAKKVPQGKKPGAKSRLRRKHSSKHTFESYTDEVFNIWKAFGGNTRDFGSFREEIDKTTDLHQHLSRISTQRLETASQNTRDAVTNPTMTVSQHFTTTSSCTTQPKI
ncbi:hypothetical protein Tco_1442631 [Tanacetum coccineum]